METNEALNKDQTDTLAGDVVRLKEDIKHYFSNFSSFIQERVTNRTAKEFIILIFISGASNITFTKFSGWSALASALVLAGIVGGYASYYVQGFFYKLGVTLSGGSIDWGTARNITLFSGIPLAVVTLTLYFLTVLINESGSMELKAFFVPFDFAGSLLSLALTFLSLIFCYQAARNIAGTSKIRSIIFLIVVPIIFMTLFLILAMSQNIY